MLGVLSQVSIVCLILFVIAPINLMSKFETYSNCQSCKFQVQLLSIRCDEMKKKEFISHLAFQKKKLNVLIRLPGYEEKKYEYTLVP